MKNHRAFRTAIGDTYQQRLSQAGFTLVEILIAVLILGIVLSTVYGAYTGTLRVASTTDQDDAAYGSARSFFVRVTKDIGAMAPYREGYIFTAKPFDIRNQTFLKLSFRSTAFLAFSEKDFASGIAEITYDIIEDPASGSFQLLRRNNLLEETIGKETSQTPLTREVLLKKSFILCSGIQSITFKFYDATGKEYDTWDSGSDIEAQKKQAPTMIMIKLNLLNPGNRERPLSYMTRIVVPANKLDVL